MSIHKSFKNIFLGILFLSFFVIPNVVEAGYDIAGDKSKTINNLSTGSFYSEITTTGGPMSPAGGTTYSDDPSKGVAIDLYSKDETVNGTQLTSSRFNGLKAKLDAGGSTVKNLSINDVYQINTKSGSIFILKGADGKDKILAIATSDKKMFVPKNPVLKESGDKKSLDPRTGYGFLNLTDQARGLDIGTTSGYKNVESDKMQEKEAAQAEFDRLDAIAKQKQEEADTITADPYSTPDQVSKAIQEARDARKAADEAGRSVWQAGGQLAQIEAAKAATGIPPTPDRCSGWSSITDFYCIAMGIAKITNIIFKLASFITYVVGTLFDYSLELSMNSAEFFKKLGVVEITWSFIRDLLNITFIFILLWTAIQILIGNDAQYNAKKVLMNVVIVAILINFSLFAAKLMVDGSNIVSLKIYEAMKVSTSEKSATISERVMNTVGLSAMYDITQIFNTNNTQTMAGSVCEKDPGALITISVMGTIFLAILSLALGLAAVLFLIRLMNILILFIKSPLWVWGHVLPGNQSMQKIKNNWWNEMKHVLTFPIMYMFWMLVAIIVFDKLGQVKAVSGANGTRTTLLDLICSGPGTSGSLSSSISLIAIFVIVIILMMRAVQYGIKNATTPEQSFGSGMAKSVAGKFGGWQDAITKNLARKTGTAVVGAGALAAGAGIGAAKWGTTKSLNLAGGVVGGGLNKLRGKDFSEGFYGGAGMTTKEMMRDYARTVAANNSNNWLGSKAAQFANKQKDPTNSRGETREQMIERQTKGAQEDRKLVAEAISAKYKAQTQDEYKKANKNSTDTDYEKYLEDLIKKRTEALLGAGITGFDSDKKDNKGNTLSHLDNLRTSIERQEVDDGKGGKITKIRLNEEKMAGEIEGIVRYHTEGAGKNVHDLTKAQQKALDIFRGGKGATSKARIKAIKASVSADKKKGRESNNEANTTQNYEKTIKDLTKKLENLPAEDDIKKLTDLTQSGGPQIFNGYGSNNNKTNIPKLNKAIIEYNIENMNPSPNPAKIKKLEEAIKEAHDSYIEYLNQTKSKLVQAQSGYSDHLQRIEDKKAKK